MKALPDRLVFLYSFSFRHGVPEQANFVFDMRGLPNPFYVESLRPMTGLDAAVSDYIFSFSQSVRMRDQICALLETEVLLSEARNQEPLVIAFGCTGGQHRSVAMAETVSRFLQSHGLKTLVQHRELADGVLHNIT